MKPSVYIESSMVGYLASRPSRDVVVAARQTITHDWWTNHRHRFDLRISALVEVEISRGDEEAARRRLDWITDIPSFAISDQAADLARHLLVEKAIPAGREDDALHIAIATAQGADFILTWNFRHMNNAGNRSVLWRAGLERG